MMKVLAVDDPQSEAGLWTKSDDEWIVIQDLLGRKVPLANLRAWSRWD